MPQQYEVEKILGKRMRNQRWEYKIKWLGYDENDCTWEPESNLTTCRDMVKKYNQSQKMDVEKPQSSYKPKITPTQRPNVAAKTLTFEQKGKDQKMKKKNKQSDNEDDYYAQEDIEQQEQEQEPAPPNPKLKRGPPNTPKGPTPRKSVRLNRGPSSGRFEPDTADAEAENEEEIEQQQEQMDEEVAEPRNSSNKLGDADNNSIKVLGMLKNREKETFFRIKENGKTTCLSRDELVEKDPISLIVFYEKNLRVFPPKN